MAGLFESTTINTMTLANRFVRSAIWMGMANEDGSVTQRLIDEMVELAEGGVGLIITGLTSVHRSGRNAPWQVSIYDDEYISGLTEMVEAIHKTSGKIAVQIAHGGVQGNAGRLAEQATDDNGHDHQRFEPVTVDDARQVFEPFFNS